jgi:hypothetical protein
MPTELLVLDSTIVWWHRLPSHEVVLKDRHSVHRALRQRNLVWSSSELGHLAFNTLQKVSCVWEMKSVSSTFALTLSRIRVDGWHCLDALRASTSMTFYSQVNAPLPSTERFTATPGVSVSCHH